MNKRNEEGEVARAMVEIIGTEQTGIQGSMRVTVELYLKPRFCSETWGHERKNCHLFLCHSVQESTW